MANLKTTLIDGGIDLSKWGIGKAKTVAHLEKEVFFGETVISKDEKGELVRNIRISFANIFYTDEEGSRYLLKEGVQTFADGRKRKRQHDVSISEKCQFDEDSKDTIIRGLEEEIGIKKTFSVESLNDEVVTMEPDSYPGLTTTYTTYEFKIEIPKEEFKPEGYSENENGLINTFYWEKI